MEPHQQDPNQHQQQQQQQQLQQQHEENSSGSSSKSSFLCRQTSTRWTPTSDQIRILKDLYYNNGVRSPSAEQIQRISARLRQYGKIEGKNVFYWFQNHKARERQKKRFTNDPTTMSMQMHRATTATGHAKYITTSPGISSPSSAGVLGVGQMGSNMGYGSVVMEKSFRDCSISPGGGGGSNIGGYGSMNNNFGWIGATVDPYPFFNKTKHIQKFQEEEEEDCSQTEIETLPLFPMHGEDSARYGSGNPNPNPNWNWFRPGDEMIESRTSLELSLNSYSGGSINN